MKPHDQSYPEPTGNLPPGRPEGRAIAGRIDRAAPPPWETAPAPALSGTPDLKTLLHGLRRRWFSAFTLGGALAVLAGVVACCLMSPKYTAVAQLRVLAGTPSMIPDPHAGREDFKLYIKTISQQIKSRPVIREALKQDKVVALRLDDQESDPIAFVDDALKVEFLESSEILTLTLASNDPTVSLTLLKAIVDSFNNLIVFAEENQRRDRVARLGKTFQKARVELGDLRSRFDIDASNSKGVIDPKAPPFQQTIDYSNLLEAKKDRNTIYYKLVNARADLLSLEKSTKKAKVSDAALGATVDADPKVKDLQDRIKVQQRQLEQIGTTYLPSGEAAAKRLKSLKTELEERRNEIREDLKARVKANAEEIQEQERLRLETLIESLEKQHDLLVTAVNELTERMKEYGKLDPKLQQLLSEIALKEKIVEDVGKQRDREQLEQDAGPRVLVASEPDLQKKDIRKQVAVAVVAPVFTLLSVCAGLAWLDCRQRRVHSANHVAQGLGIPVVGAVPNLPNLERHLVGPGGETDLQGHPVMESIDSLRTRLLREAEAESTRVVLVTSAGPGEGKTTLAAHLAGSLARAGRKTLLIDGDLRTPAAHQLFELPQQPGFSEVLLGEVEAADAVQPTPIDGLALMAAGQWDREVMQALARDGMEGIFEKLLEEFDFILIDSHPVMSATDALLIGQRSDAVIVSVLREVSRAPQVYGACQRLTALGIRVFGAVVNGTDPDEVIAPPAPAAALAG